MTVRLNTTAAKSFLSENDIQTIQQLFEETVARVQSLLPLGEIEVRICNGSGGWVQPKWGVNGFAGDHVIELYLDPQYPRWRDKEGQSIFSSTLAHELHHVVRRCDVVYDRTLPECLVSEGLAMNFEKEVGYRNGFPDPLLSEIGRFRTLAREAARLLASEHDRNEVFGPGDEKSLYWQIHDLGYVVVKSWLDRSKLTASTAVHTDAATIIQSWLESGYLLDDHVPTQKLTSPKSRNPSP